MNEYKLPKPTEDGNLKIIKVYKYFYSVDEFVKFYKENAAFKRYVDSRPDEYYYLLLYINTD